MTFVRIPVGEFVQGSDEGFDDEKPARKRRMAEERGRHDDLLAPTLRPGVRHRPWSELVDDLWSEV